MAPTSSDGVNITPGAPLRMHKIVAGQRVRGLERRRNDVASYRWQGSGGSQFHGDITPRIMPEFHHHVTFGGRRCRLWVCCNLLPPRDGYDLAMNRDERINRGVALPPLRARANGVEAIYPRDVEGGTWIAANALGIALALLNGNDVPCDARKEQSRGLLIPALIAGSTSQEVRAALEYMDLRGILPFRIAGFFPGKKQIVEWRWDLASLQLHSFPWERRYWFSSSLSDARASELRDGREPSAGNSGRLIFSIRLWSSTSHTWASDSAVGRSLPPPTLRSPPADSSASPSNRSSSI